MYTFSSSQWEQLNLSPMIDICLVELDRKWDRKLSFAREIGEWNAIFMLQISKGKYKMAYTCFIDYVLVFDKL